MCGVLLIKYVIVDARREFLSELRGVRDPEVKRRIIGAKFIEIFERIAREAVVLAVYDYNNSSTTTS